ncbi:hypothetical protein ACTJKQ_17870 [Acidovorax sp. 22279]|uniref:hypothetical protein n=1 Tax=Acidovorax sp. 22279 TaxID=3453900 RepID=UPI003F86A441
MTATSPVRTPPATQGAARAVAAPAAPVLGVCTRSYVKVSSSVLRWSRIQIKGQSL